MPQPLINEPRDLLLGDDNDIVITNDLVWVTGIDAVAQSCRIALKMYKGEWFADLDVGIPYFDGILGGKPEAAMALARAEFIDELLKVEGVIEVVLLTVAYSKDRTLSVTWRVRTALGETPEDTLEVGL